MTGGSIPPPTTGLWCMIPSTGGSNPPGSGDEPDRPTNNINNINMQIKFKRLSEKAVQPIRATVGSAGYDLTSTHVTTEVSECGQLILVYHTDIAVEIPEGYMGLVFPRSSISKKSLRMCNSVGVVDSDYRGEITCKFIVTTDVIPSLYKEGERFAQLIIVPFAAAEFTEAEELSNTGRGEDGYGSTGAEKLQSAPDASAGSSEDKSELINQESEPEGSGGEENIPEQAQ